MLSYAGLPCPKPKCKDGFKAIPTEIETLDGCPYYKCLASEDFPGCKKPDCPEGYIPSKINDRAAKLRESNTVITAYAAPVTEECPRYECIPEPESSTEAVPNPLKRKNKCTLQGKTITTLDNVTLVNDLCYNTILQNAEEKITVNCK